MRRIEKLRADIKQMEEALTQRGETFDKEVDEDLITNQLLAESSNLLATAMKEDKGTLSTEDSSEEEGADSPGDEWMSCEAQLEALASLTGICFSSVESCYKVQEGCAMRHIVLDGSAADLSFTMDIDVSVGNKSEHAPRVLHCALTVPSEARPELASFIACVSKEHALTTALRGLSKFANATRERQRLFVSLQKQFPGWICLPHGSLATPLLCVRPPPGHHADFVFDFLWQMEVAPTGALKHNVSLVPRVTQEFVDCDEDDVLKQIDNQFHTLATVKGLGGALEIMIAIAVGIEK